MDESTNVLDLIGRALVDSSFFQFVSKLPKLLEAYAGKLIIFGPTLYYFEGDLNIYLEEDQLRIQLYSDVLVKNLMLYSNDVTGIFESNYFDLIPGKMKEVIFYPSSKILKEDLNLNTYIKGKK